MQIYGGVEIQIDARLTSVADRDEWSVSSDRRLGGFQSLSERGDKEKSPSRKWNPVIQPAA
jgi:hypothetical protein